MPSNKQKSNTNSRNKGHKTLEERPAVMYFEKREGQIDPFGTKGAVIWSMYIGKQTMVLKDTRKAEWMERQIRKLVDTKLRKFTRIDDMSENTDNEQPDIMNQENWRDERTNIKYLIYQPIKQHTKESHQYS